ncbi:MAG: hypothetical protein QGG71_24465 [Pirellulaceae bacterium]|nr:hypothetical protein [Pirellulaceae bacterium]
MSTMTRKQRTYDHRRELVQTTRDIQLATQHGVPASTARGWLNKPATEVVSLNVLDLNTMRLPHEVIQLRRRVTKLTALLHRQQASQPCWSMAASRTSIQPWTKWSHPAF